MTSLGLLAVYDKCESFLTKNLTVFIQLKDSGFPFQNRPKYVNDSCVVLLFDDDPLSKSFLKSRSVLQDGSRFLDCFFKEKKNFIIE